MRRIKILLATLAATVVLAGCATAAGGLIGAGIGGASGDAAAGAMIGAGIGMMIDVMN